MNKLIGFITAAGSEKLVSTQKNNDLNIAGERLSPRILAFANW